MPARSAVWAGLGCWLTSALLTPAFAAAQPLNLADPTPRTIQVQFETSLAPGTIGQTYSAPYAAQYSATGNVGTVVIPRAVYEAAIQTHGLDYFDSMMTWSLISGSAADFILDIDLTTLQASAHTLVYHVSITIPVQQDGTVTRNLGTTTTAGYTYLPQYPGFPFFCATCVLVPGAAYDPVTGKLNAVGSDRIVAPDFSLTSFSRAGDLRLSEGPAPGVPALSAYGLAGLAIVLASLAVLMLRPLR
jgi:hypothetical protein